MSPQLPPEGISQSAWDEARRVWAEMLTVDHDGASAFHTQRDCEELAQAIMAATERAALIAADYGDWAEPMRSQPQFAAACVAADEIAAAIRQGSQPSNVIPHLGTVLAK